MTSTNNFRAAGTFVINSKTGVIVFNEMKAELLFLAPVVRKMREEKSVATLSFYQGDDLGKGLRYFLNDDQTAGFALTPEGQPVCMFAFDREGLQALLNLKGSNRNAGVEHALFNDHFVGDFASHNWPTSVCEWYQSARVRGQLVAA